MPDKKEKIFPAGMFLAEPREGAPEFVKGSLGIKVAEAVQFLTQHQNNAGYVNLDLKESLGGKLYLELNQWEPKKKEEAPKEAAQGPVQTDVDYPEEEITPDDIPF